MANKMGGWMKKSMLMFLTLVVLVCFSCSGKKAEETYETAQFEELQKNYVHARQLYEEIIAKYPESDYAAKASEKLKALEGQK
jgi:outer membrane protein assembly factor BamD (BamD/ComL family)